jgi:hypothetical protein
MAMLELKNFTAGKRADVLAEMWIDNRLIGYVTSRARRNEYDWVDLGASLGTKVWCEALLTRRRRYRQPLAVSLGTPTPSNIVPTPQSRIPRGAITFILMR